VPILVPTARAARWSCRPKQGGDAPSISARECRHPAPIVLALDTGGTGLMSLAATYATGDEPMAKDAALARDGVSCTACHHIAAEGLGDPSTFTGQFHLGPADALYGQYDDSLPYAMDQTVGATPTFGAHMSDSALCGSCHTVMTPILDVGVSCTPARMTTARTEHEQTTYLEWVNSAFSVLPDMTKRRNLDRVPIMPSGRAS
jgi:hypothetical protein